MIEMAITLGLFLSLISYEIFGFAAGGIVVPGYIALQMADAWKMAGTFLVSILTYFIIKIAAEYTFLYGRRQMVLSLLIGCLLANLSRYFFHFDLGSGVIELSAMGWVIPGLIAHWFSKQGIIRTSCVLIITSVLVRLLVILLYNGELLPQ